ncbi:MAG: SGNH/GDSL hydrolase family protein [Streptosporangiales bacterium]|nr:SGNH/GDSL hydrolase family protein [Streptosporangiales bacterium]
MIRTAQVRRIATATAYGGGGLTFLGAVTVSVLFLEARLARRTIGDADGEPPVVDGVYGLPGAVDPAAAPIRMAMLGDSSACGFGVEDPLETPGALIASGLAAVSDRPVGLVSTARVGARSADLNDQVEQVLPMAPQVVVIFVGANDVTHRVSPALAVRQLSAAVRRLREAGAEVVVGTCPDLGTVEPIAQPLRWLARRWSRQMAAAQTVGAVEAGARSVSLTDLMGAEFASNPREMFGPDRFHPSARGYAQAAAAVLPSVSAALGFWPDSEIQPDTRRGEGVLPIYLAAAEAAEEPGTEVAATQVAGRERGPRGRWTTLMRRRRRTVPADPPVEPASEPAAQPGSHHPGD